MYLTELEYDIRLNILVYNKLRQRVASLCVGITQAHLGIAILIQADCGHIEELDVLVEVHPKDPIKLVVHDYLVLHVLHPEGCHRVPLTMPLASGSCTVWITYLNKSHDAPVLGVYHSSGMYKGVYVVVCKATLFDRLSLVQNHGIDRAYHWQISYCSVTDSLPKTIFVDTFVLHTVRREPCECIKRLVGLTPFNSFVATICFRICFFENLNPYLSITGLS